MAETGSTVTAAAASAASLRACSTGGSETAACVTRILRHEYCTALCTGTLIDELCTYSTERVREEMRDGVGVWRTPVIVQIHGVYVSTLEGERTPVCPFSVAARIWLWVGRALEHLAVPGVVSVAPLIERIMRTVKEVREDEGVVK